MNYPTRSLTLMIASSTDMTMVPIMTAINNVTTGVNTDNSRSMVFRTSRS